VVLDRVGAQAEARGNLAVREAFGHHAHNLLLPLGKQRGACGADYADWFPLPQGLDDPLELTAVSPDLPGMHAPNAFAQYLEPFSRAEHTSRSVRKGLDHLFWLGAIQKHDSTCR
jgi:hypothetical protein